MFSDVMGKKNKDPGFIDSVKNAFLWLNCQQQPVYVSKCIESYETTLVRHGIMLVGGSLGGKTVSWNALAQAMCDRVKAGIDKPVHTESLNLKAISIAELYDSFNPVTSDNAPSLNRQS